MKVGDVEKPETVVVTIAVCVCHCRIDRLDRLDPHVFGVAIFPKGGRLLDSIRCSRFNLNLGHCELRSARQTASKLGDFRHSFSVCGRSPGGASRIFRFRAGESSRRFSGRPGNRRGDVRNCPSLRSMVVAVALVALTLQSCCRIEHSF